MNPRRLDFVIDRQWAGRPVHDLLRRKLGLSGTLLRRIKWLEDGILLDGQRVHTRVIVREGQTLSVRLSDPTVKSGIPPVSLPLDVVYEDRDIAVVNKAPGMPSHPGPGHWQDSLGNALMSHWQETDPDADFHPVHRLDKGTSGLMVVAKHPFAQEELRKALHSGRFRRQYLAICEGVLSPGQGVIDLAIGRCPDSILKRQVSEDGQRAVTRYTVLKTDHGRLSLRHRGSPPDLPACPPQLEAGPASSCYRGAPVLHSGYAGRYDAAYACIFVKLMHEFFQIVNLYIFVVSAPAAYQPAFLFRFFL